MSLSELWNQYLNIEPGVGQIALRLACAMLVGTLIGAEREFTHRPAGLRTHILVALGACVVSITGEMLFTHYNALGATPDPARLSAQVITGMGFLGAGTIMKAGVNVKGLTTAASVWAVACLGIAAGYGFYLLALLGMLFTMLTLTVFEAVQRRFMQGGAFDEGYVLETEDISASLTRLTALAQEQRLTLFDFAAEQLETGHRLTFRIHASGRRSRLHQQRFYEALATAPESRSLRPDSNAGVPVT